MEVECSQEQPRSGLNNLDSLNSKNGCPINPNKQTSTDTNQTSTEDLNHLPSQNISPTAEREDGIKTKDHSAELIRETLLCQSTGCQPILAKRKHDELDRSMLGQTNQTDMMDEVCEEDNSESGMLTRKLMKISQEVFNALNINQKICYDPIQIKTIESEQLKNNFMTRAVKLFSNENVSKVFSSSKDIRVIQNDTPERLQLLIGNLCEKSNSEIDVNLIKWICSHEDLACYSPEIITPQVVENILILILKQKLEIMTIWNNEKNFIPNITLEILWKIFNLLILYKDDLYYSKSRHDEVAIEMYSIKQISEAVLSFMKIASTKQDFQDIYLYFEYLKCCFDIQTKKQSKIQPFHLNIINSARELSIPQNIYQIFEESTVCAEILLQKIINKDFETSNNHLNMYKSNHSQMLPDQLMNSQDLVEQIIKNQQNNNNNIDQNLQLIQNYICLDYLHNPIIKKFIIDQYYKHAVLSTNTLSHVIDFNIYHQYFAAKKIDKKPLSEIHYEEYLTILQAVEQNLVECKIQLTWQVENNNDLIYQQLEPIFQTSLASQSETLKQFISNLLQKLLNNYLYPYAQNEMRRILKDQSLKEVRNICLEKFKEYLSYGPYVIKDSKDKYARPETILSFYVLETTGAIGVSMINEAGKEVYKSFIEYYFNADKIVAQKRDTEIKNLYDFIRNRQPNVIIVSSNSTRSLVLKSNLYIQFKNLCKNIVMAEQSMMTCYLHQSQLIQSPKDKYIFMARKQARSFQFRLSEICSLWTYEKNPILDINFHPFQSKVDSKELQIRYEEAIQERICQDGIEFKLLFDKSSSQKEFLQFIPGFGPRKSVFLQAQMEEIKDLKEINTRQKFINLCLMDQNLITNCMPFIKFSKSDNPLDQTKIPYNQYFIVNEMMQILYKSENNNEMSDFNNPEDSEKKDDKKQYQYLNQILQSSDRLLNVKWINYSRSKETQFSRENMSLVIDNILQELMKHSQRNNINDKIFQDMNLQQIFKSIYKAPLSCISKGALLKLRFRDSTDKYIEFTSVDHKIRTRLMRSDIPKNLPVEKYFLKKKNTEVELVVDSLRVFDTPVENNHLIDSIFDNRLTFTYPNYEELVKKIIPEYSQSIYFKDIDSSDFPSTKIDLYSQFNVFFKEMDQNPHNVIDLTGSASQQPQSNFNSMAQQQSSSNSNWGSSQISSSNNDNASSSNSGWGNTNTTSNNNSGSSWGGSNSNTSSEQPLRQRNQNSSDNSSSWGNSGSSNSDQGQQQDTYQKPLRTGGNRNNNNQGEQSNSGGWGSTSGSTNQQSSSNSGGWGSSSTSSTAQQESSSGGGWGATSSSNSAQQDGGSGWGASTSSSTQQQSSGQQESSGGWGSSSTTAQSSGGWGSSSTNNTTSSGGWGSTDQGQSSGTGESGWNEGGGSSSGWGASTSSSGGFGGSSGGGRDQSNNRNRGGGNGGNNGGKGCFKCGKEGHMSKDCPDPSKKGNGCFKCGKEGHMSRECTEPYQNKRPGGACFKCNQEGHMSRDCPNPKTNNNGNRDGQQKKGSCFKCGEEGHMSRECPNPQQQRSGGNNTCYKCKKEGHQSKDCPDNPGPSKCFNCNEQGHMSRECPNPPKKRSCYNCGDEGHSSKDCTQERKHRQFDRNNNNNNRNNNSSFGGGGGSSSGGWGSSDTSNNQWGSSSDAQQSTTTNGWGSSSDAQQSTTSNGWGSTTNDSSDKPTSSNNTGGGWGSSSSSTNNNNNNSWGASSNNNNEKASSNEGQGNGGWGSSTATTNTNKDSGSGGWGNSTTTSSGNGGW